MIPDCNTNTMEIWLFIEVMRNHYIVYNGILHYMINPYAFNHLLNTVSSQYIITFRNEKAYANYILKSLIH